MTRIKTIKLKTLKQKIAAARRDLHAAWAAQGRTDATVLSAAAKLDKLCNEYERLIRGKDPLGVTLKNRKVKESGNWLRI